MTLVFAERVHSENRTQLLQWGVSLLVVLAVHIGVAFWLLPKDTPAKPDTPPPAAFLDLPALPLPGAGGTPGTSLPKPAQTKPPVNSPPAAPKSVAPAVLPPQPNPQPETAPVPKIIAPPAAAPKAVLPKTPPPKPPKPQAAQPQPPKPKVPVAPVDQNPSLTGSAPIVRLSAIGAWQAGVVDRLQKFQVYPPDIRRGQVVSAVDVVFVIDRQGKILSYSIAIPSGIPSLDAAALEMVRRAQWLPPPPEQLIGQAQKFSFQMTVRFF